MGDRANIVIIEEIEGADPHEAVFLYGHWSGYDLPETLAASLKRGEARWNDAQYLARIVFQDMIRDDEGLTGFGISTRMCDNSYPLLVLDIARRRVVEYPEQVYIDHGFAKLAEHEGIPFDSYDGKWASARAEGES
jgi:hypothetical protein